MISIVTVIAMNANNITGAVSSSIYTVLILNTRFY